MHDAAIQMLKISNVRSAPCPEAATADPAARNSCRLRAGTWHVHHQPPVLADLHVQHPALADLHVHHPALADDRGPYPVTELDNRDS